MTRVFVLCDAMDCWQNHCHDKFLGIMYCRNVTDVYCVMKINSRKIDYKVENIVL